MRQHSRPLKTALVVVLLVFVLLLGVADYLTGSELAFSVFYLFPLGLAAWYVGWEAGVLLSVVSAFSWYLADTLARTVPYTHPFIPVWNAGARLVTFLVVTMLLVALREALERESLHARVDHLTGAANARSFYEAAEVEISKLKRYGRPFSLLYLDVDDLKQVNDARGHAAGDATLRATVSALKLTLRAGDTIARLGGDEFAILLAEADGHAAEVASTRVQSALLQGARMQDQVTCSIGVLTCSSPPRSVDELIERADHLMYEAKRGGKNAIRQGDYGATA